MNTAMMKQNGGYEEVYTVERNGQHEQEIRQAAGYFRNDQAAGSRGQEISGDEQRLPEIFFGKVFDSGFHLLIRGRRICRQNQSARFFYGSGKGNMVK